MIAAIMIWCLTIVRIPRKTAFMITLIFMIPYAFASGAAPPIVRAVLMFAVLVIGYLLNRDEDMLNTLAVAAFLTLLYNPRILFDPSFQLSYASMAGMIIFTPRIDAMLGAKNIKETNYPNRAVYYLLKGVSVSAAALVLTWPIVLVYFNIVSPMAFIANLVIVPMLSVIMATASAFVVLSHISQMAGFAIAGGTTFILNILFSINHTLAGVPFAYFRAGALSPPELMAYYAFIFLMITPFMPKKRLVLFALLICNIFVWQKVVMPGRETAEISFLDVGKGDAALIRSHGRAVLIDGGEGGGDGFDAGRSIVAPYLWNKGVRRIDAVVMTHAHADHLGGLLYILSNFDVGCVIDNGIPSDEKLYLSYKKLLRKKKIRHITVGAGDEIYGFGGFDITVLNPPRADLSSGHVESENDSSVVIKLSGGKFSALFCGDIMDRAMGEMLSYDNLLRSDVVKIPHHGSGAGKEEVVKIFLKKISPTYSVISSGKLAEKNTQNNIIINILTGLGSICYSTANGGAVVISVDDNGYSIKYG